MQQQNLKCKTFDYKGQFITYKDCFFVLGEYAIGGTAIELYGDCGSKYPEPILTVTVCLEPLSEPDLAYIKNYSENEGVLERLVDLGFAERTGISRLSGYVRIELCRLNLDKIKEYAVYENL